jgi:hypothetical protein
MMKRAVVLAVLLLMPLASDIGPAAATAGAYRPDAWIKLCGLSDGCTIDPLPHPWKGNDVYNTTGAKQSIKHNIEEMEGIRVWIRLQNDGTSDDTLVVQGCQGSNHFTVNKVLLGKQKRPRFGTTDVTRQFKNGTLSFDLAANDANSAIFTLNIIATTKTQGVSYRCPVTISSQGDPTLTDTIAVSLTTV